ncbi:MAG: S9 family peptidase [Candidatus Neomarinimicrobiota bacterium]|nr:S9 family peptidase [Candidatus Neomarinimicrobiota bacterium]
MSDLKHIIIFLVFSLCWVLPAGRPITPEDIVNIQYVSDAVISPDGNNVAFVLIVPRSEDEDPGLSHSEIWIKRKGDPRSRRYTSKTFDSYSPGWSTDGKKITFLSDRDSKKSGTKIYTIAADGGEADVLLEHPTGISSYKLSPDGKWIAFLSTDSISGDRTKKMKKGYDMIVMDELHRYNRIWLYSMGSKETKLIYNNDLNVSSYTWSDDSKSIIFKATDKPGADATLMDQVLYSVNIPKNKPQNIIKTPGKLGSMDISPNGDQLAFLGAISRNDPLPQSIFITSLILKDKIKVHSRDNESFFYVQWINNETLLAHSIRGTRTVLSLISNVHQKNDESLVQEDILMPDLIISSVRFHSPSAQLAIIGHSPQHPNELHLNDLYDNNLTRLTYSNLVLDKIILSPQETIQWKANDGLTIQGILTYPINYREGAKYPLILQIHGGPEGVTLDGWNTTSLYPIQLLSAQGFMVLQPNYRGSGGRGVQFSKDDHNDLGGKEYQDVLAGIDYLVAKELVKKNHVGTGGWSYGGYFSALGATTYSPRFKASMVGAGLTNMISFMGTTDIPYEMSIVHWNSWWFDNMELHWNRSPLSHINMAQTPTLVIHGMKDERVHPEQGMELWQALRIKGVDTELVLYPREPHGLNERGHRLDYMNRLINWYNKYVK